MRYFSDSDCCWANGMALNAGTARFISKGLDSQNMRGRQEGKGLQNLSSWMMSKESFCSFLHTIESKALHVTSHTWDAVTKSLPSFLLSEVVLGNHFAVLKFSSYSFPKPHPFLLFSPHSPQKHPLSCRACISNFRALYNR